MLEKLIEKITRRDFLKKAGRGGIIVGGTAIGVSSPPKAARSWGTADCFTEHQKKTMECILSGLEAGEMARSFYEWPRISVPSREGEPKNGCKERLADHRCGWRPS